MQINFSPAIFNNLENFKSFFNPQKTLESINLSKKVQSEGITSPFFILKCILLYPTVSTLNKIKRIVRIFPVGIFNKTILAGERYVHFAYAYLGNKFYYRKKLLCPAKNCHQVSPSLYSFIAPSSLKNADSALLPRVCKKRGIDLLSLEGVSKGSTIWFNILIEEAKKPPAFKALPLKERLLFVASQFINGAPPQATVLQGCYKLAKQSVTSATHHFGYTSYRKLSIKTSKIYQNMQKFLNKFNNLLDGTYYIEFPTTPERSHSISYIKEGSTSFIWDTEIGLITIDNQKDLSKYFQRKICYVPKTTLKIEQFAPTWSFLCLLPSWIW